jgi:adenine phosphoribosyltransferase
MVPCEPGQPDAAHPDPVLSDTVTPNTSPPDAAGPPDAARPPDAAGPAADAAALSALITARVRDIPDWPQPGVTFKDITPLLADPAAFAAVVDGLAAGHAGVDRVAGIEARGFILAAPAACALGAGFVPVRKQGKLPGPSYAQSYALEYGTATLEVHQDAFGPGDRVLIVDDVLATGGTAAATVDLVRRSGAVVEAVAVLLELGFLHGREALPGVPVRALLTV